ncbi:MAG: MaoC/PaaZ C-terminal domain-containing protein [Candidatus Rokuibacteriota bacterium]
MTTRTLSASMVGLEVAAAVHTIDARWLMAYAAALGIEDARYFDTQNAAGPLAHPLFAVCYEWPLALAVRDRVIGPDIAPFGVHATHALTIHRPPRAGDTLHTSARVIAAEPRRAGTLVTVRFTTRDTGGAAVTTTDYGSLYRGVALAEPGGSAPPREQAAAAPGEAVWQEPLAIAAGAAHVYTECARIWNPIHTDIAVARAAGLPALILHGTATLALAVSRVMARQAGNDGRRVRAVQARFTGMVVMPSTLTVRGHAARDGAIAFDALAAGGARVLQGALSL